MYAYYAQGWEIGKSVYKMNARDNDFIYYFKFIETIEVSYEKKLKRSYYLK